MFYNMFHDEPVSCYELVSIFIRFSGKDKKKIYFYFPSEKNFLPV